MTDYRLFGVTSGPGSQVTDPDNYTMAVEFYVTGTAWLKEIRFWASAEVAGSNHAVRLYQVTNGSSGTLVSDSSMALPSPLQAGWNAAVFASPIPLTPNQRYRAGVYFTTNDGYTATAAFWSSGSGASGITNGILTAPPASDAIGGAQGSFIDFSDSYPNLQFNSGNYWIDVTVTDTPPTPDPPVVDAGADITITLGQPVNRTASATNTPTSWEWSTTTGPGSPASIGAAAALSWTPSVAGTYTLQAAATNAGGTGTDTLTLIVNEPPPPPGRSFGTHSMFAV